MDDLVSTTLNNGVRIPLLGFSPEMKVVKSTFFIATNSSKHYQVMNNTVQTIGLSWANTEWSMMWIYVTRGIAYYIYTGIHCDF